jgi:hypothetical protein
VTVSTAPWMRARVFRKDAKQILGFLRHQGAEVWGKARHRQ